MRGKLHVPTTKLRREIECFASYGIPEVNIARVFGVPLTTLRKHYKDELECGHDKANAQVAGFLFAAAKKGSVSAMIFWLKCRARWSEPRDQSIVATPAMGKKEAARAAARLPDTGTALGNLMAIRQSSDNIPN